MYLKSIEVNGFKSFADKIIFKFNNGITGIVGPNGSGKSNVGDAVRWVLGEQSAKQLRGAKMEDVIFSGTELRKPQSFAYVAITLDNSDHRLPIDYNEVTVARRVYRSGESEYLINGVVSRLKDVNSLFFDTGIGKEGYSIIGQGQIEKILSGKPEEKRELFDEAAGIVKYKKNKAATEKTLENERLNLARVNDILSELEKQVGPLKSQSETARKYLIYKEELKRFDINAFLMENDSNKQRLEEYTEKLELVSADSQRLTAELDEAKAEYERIENKLEQFNTLIESEKNELHEKKLDNQRYEGEINVLNQRILSHKQNEDNLNEQLEKLNQDLFKSKEELTRLYEEKNILDEKLDNADEVLDNAESEYNSLVADIADKEKQIERSKAEIIELLNKGGTLKAKVGRYDTMLENISLRKKELESKFLDNKAEEERNKRELEQLSRALEEIGSDKTEHEQKAASIAAKIDDNKNSFDTISKRITQTEHDIVSLKSKKEALRNLTERYDGYGNGIKKIMEQKSHNAGLIGVVADILKVDRRYETAIETALGGSIKNIVTEDEDTAKRMIDYLKKNHLGRATFLPINAITAAATLNNDVLKEPGVINVASELVECESKYSIVARHLLGRIYVVDNIDNAIKISRKYRQSLRIVTIDGELITPGGAMTGGAFKNSSNLLGRKRELDEIDEQITAKRAQLDKDRVSIDALNAERDMLKKEREEIAEALQAIMIRHNTYSLNMEQAKKREEEILTLYARISRENTELKSQVDEINNNKDDIASSNRLQEEAVKQLEDNISRLEEEIAEAKKKQETAANNLSSLKLEFNSIKQQYDFMMQNINRVKGDETAANEALLQLKNKLGEGFSELNYINKKIVNLKAYLDENNKAIAVKEEKIAEYTAEKNELNNSHKDFFEKREKLSDTINGLDKSAFKLTSSIEKLNESMDSLNNYMWDEYQLTYNLAAEYKDETMTDISSLKREISAVKSKIKQLGDVNVNAIEDYKQVSERYEFLKTQHDDITKAEQNLLNIINELDKSMRAQFAEKFQEIRTMFTKVFKELFGGGKAELELVDAEDILETGIRIIAQPPGKKLQNMMQLSGGEKSLTAIALLFAIQSLKPSPFCLLDEIEAALDDSNVKRYAKYLGKLTKDTQFIVITHRKGTMEAADILYGITMQEKGVSTLVSVNMIENDLDD